MQLYDPATGKWYNYTSGVVRNENSSSTGAYNGFDQRGNRGGSSAVPGIPGLTPAGPSVTPINATSFDTVDAPPAPIDVNNASAAQLASWTLASEFYDWEHTYKPMELNLLNESSLSNPNVLKNAVSDAASSAAATSDVMVGVGQRRLAARGIAPTAQQQMVSSRLSNLSKAANIAGAENQARQQVAINDQLIAVGSAPNPNVVKGQSANQY